MKFARVSLIGSLLANAALLAVLFFAQRSPPEMKLGARPPPSTPHPPIERRGEVSPLEDWASLQGGDLRELVAKLRSAGYPPAVVRAIVGALLAEQFGAKRNALLAALGDIPYWKNPGGNAFDFKTRTQLRELSRERTRLLDELLGPDARLPMGVLDPFQGRSFNGVPPAKTAALQSVLSDYAEMRSLVRDQMGGVMLAQDRAKIALLDQEQHADLASLLTPQELDDYEMRNSRTALELRGTLGIFNPTEDEFRSIFKLKQAFDNQYGMGDGSRAANEQKKEGATALEAQLKAALSPARFADYQLAADPDSQPTNRLLARFGLPIDTARAAKAIQEEATREVRALEQSRPPVDQLNAGLSSLSQKTDRRLTGLLGAEVYDAYKEVNPGWLRLLRPRETRPLPSRTKS